MKLDTDIIEKIYGSRLTEEDININGENMPFEIYDGFACYYDEKEDANYCIIFPTQSAIERAGETFSKPVREILELEENASLTTANYASVLGTVYKNGVEI